MDKLNQALIRVYSKQKVNNGPEPAPEATADHDRAKVSARRSAVKLPLMEVGQRRWRIDVPAVAESGASAHLHAPHADFPSVEHVESYDLDALRGTVADRVVWCDHMPADSTDDADLNSASETPESQPVPEETPAGQGMPGDIAVESDAVAANSPVDEAALPADDDDAATDWLFALDVQPTSLSLDAEGFREQPVAALQLPSQWSDDLTQIRVSMADAPPATESPVRPLGESAGPPADDSAAQPERSEAPESGCPGDLPNAENLSNADEGLENADGPESCPAAPATLAAESAQDAPQDAEQTPAVHEPTEPTLPLNPQAADEAAKLDDAESPERLDEPATVMDAAPSVPFPEPVGVADHHWLDDTMTETVVASEPTTIPFAAAWEVDRYYWPEICDQLEHALKGPLVQSGEALRDATGDDLRVLAITSAQRREGRTTLALTLARSAARAGARVALLDNDRANPDLARQLGIDAPCSWQQAAASGQPLAETAVWSIEDKMTLIPLANAATDGSDKRAAQLLGQVLVEARAEFDLVILDMQPMTLADIESMRQLPECPIDMAVVVRNVNVTTEKDTLAAVAELQSIGVSAIGIAENFTTRASA